MNNFYKKVLFPFSIFSSQLSYADITPFNLLNQVFAKGKQIVPDELKAFPLLKEHYERVMNVPNIKKWMEERPASDM